MFLVYRERAVDEQGFAIAVYSEISDSEEMFMESYQSVQR